MIRREGTPIIIHYPKNRDKFEFDAEVATIFDDMALRSIPLYEESRRLTVRLALQMIEEAWKDSKSVSILDVGASTGAFFKDLWVELDADPMEVIPSLKADAIDASPHMVGRMQSEIPAVNSRVANGVTFEGVSGAYDMVVLSYVVQFMTPDEQLSFWPRLYKHVHDGGVVVLSGKYRPHPNIAQFEVSNYLQFRIENGYTESEIQAKTRALKNSMWPDTFERTLTQLQNAGFSGYSVLCQWLQFSTIVVYKDEIP